MNKENYFHFILKRFRPAGRVLLFVLAGLILLNMLGCGGQKRLENPYHKKEAELSEKAKSAYDKGWYKKALQLYAEALKASRAVEDTELTAINMINIAAVYRRLGRHDLAMRTVDEVLAVDYVDFPEARLAEAAMLKAQLYKDMAKFGEAQSWADRSLALCGKSDCSQKGGIYNIKASVALLQGNLDAALALGERGLEESKKAKDPSETANAFRIMGDVESEKGRLNEAQALYEQALELDKELGSSPKIALDLIMIGRLYSKQNNNHEALKYYRRSLSVSLGGGNVQGMDKAQALIDETKRKIEKERQD